MRDVFLVEPLSADLARAMRERDVWKEECPVPLDRLRRVQFAHVNETGATQTGEMIVLDAVAEEALKIFQKLYAQGFCIVRAESIHHFEGSDDLSMEANNSSAFNFRPIAGTSVPSIHSYGLAIDINPVWNPYLKVLAEGEARYYPSNGRNYVSRYKILPGMVEPIVDIFRAHGFTEWGGEWTHGIDYHHFHVPREVAEILVKMSPEEAQSFFHFYVQHTQLHGRDPAEEVRWSKLYAQNPSNFLATLLGSL